MALGDPTALTSQGAAAVGAPQLPGTTPGALGGIENFLAHPLVQGALATYLGAISSPRRLGLGHALGLGGLAGLQQFGTAERTQELLPLEQARAREALAKAGGEEAKGKAYETLGKTDPGQAQASLLGYGGAYYRGHEQAALIKQGNQEIGSQFALRHPDQLGQQIAGEIIASPKPVSLKDIESAYTEGLSNPVKMDKLRADLRASELRPAEIQAQTERAKAGTAEAGLGAALKQQQLQQFKETGSTTAPAPAVEYGPGGATKRTRSMTPDPGFEFRDPSTALGKINTDLGRFASTNPIHFYTNAEAWVKDATKYAASQNPNADLGQVEAAARALARTPVTTGTATGNTAAGGTSSKDKVAADLGL